MQIMIALPILVPYRIPEGLLEFQDETLAELRNVSGQINAIDSELGEFTVSVHDSPKSHPLIASHWAQPKTQRNYRLLIVTTEAQQYVSQLAAEYRNSDNVSIAENFESLAIESAAADLQFQVNNLLLVANLVRPGSISVEEGFVLYGQSFITRSEAFYAEDWYDAVTDAIEAGWPLFQPTAIRDAWEWLSRSGCIEQGIGRGSLGRAWAALSQVTSESLSRSGAIDLVWILVGLEALYAKGNNALKEQLVSKTEVLLGPRNKSKKDFAKMYDYRSRLLHGDIDIPLRYTPYDAVHEFETFQAELHRNGNLALAVLIATLQSLVRRSWEGFEFNYAISGREIVS